MFAAREWRFDRIAAGGEVHVTGRDLPLNAALLLQLGEAVRATVTLTARIEAGGRFIAERRVPVELLARNECPNRLRPGWPARFRLLQGPQGRRGRTEGIYRAVDVAAGEAALAAFEAGHWGQRYPAIGQSWRRAWGEGVPFYAFPSDVRRILYTTNAIEALNAKAHIG